MKLKNCVLGQRVQVKSGQSLGSGVFYSGLVGECGTIVAVESGSYNIKVKFDNGREDEGNHTNLRKIKE